MFNILAMLNREEFEEAKHIIRSKTGYDFDNTLYSDSAIVYRSPLVNIFIRTTSENQPIEMSFRGFRGDLVFINKEIVSNELLKSIFIPCCKEGINGIRNSSQFIYRISRSFVIDVLIVAEQEHFNTLQEKLRTKYYNTRNRLFVSMDQMAFYSNFIRMRVIRRRDNHCQNLRGHDADIVFVNRIDLHDIEARYRILKSCRTGKYGVHHIYDILEHGWGN